MCKGTAPYPLSSQMSEKCHVEFVLRGETFGSFMLEGGQEASWLRYIAVYKTKGAK